MDEETKQGEIIYRKRSETQRQRRTAIMKYH